MMDQDMIPLGNPTQTKNMVSPQESLLSTRNRRQTWGDIFCLKQSGLARFAVSKMIHEAFGEEALAEGQGRHYLRKALGIWGRQRKRSVWK